MSVLGHAPSTGLAGPFVAQADCLRWAMRNSWLQAFVLGICGGLAVYSGAITSATADAFGPGGKLQLCDTSTTAAAFSVCTVSAGSNSRVSAAATVDFRSVSVLIEGGAFLNGNDAQASALATYTELITIKGGSTHGIVTIEESVLRFGTGSLDSFSTGRTSVTETFIYSAPFLLTLTAATSSSFLGGECEGGSLLIRKQIDSISFRETGAQAAVAPEPSTWVLVVIGVGLVVLSRRRYVAHQTRSGDSGDDESQTAEKGGSPGWPIRDSDPV